MRGKHGQGTAVLQAKHGGAAYLGHDWHALCADSSVYSIAVLIEGILFERILLSGPFLASMPSIAHSCLPSFHLLSLGAPFVFCFFDCPCSTLKYMCACVCVCL